MAGRDSSALRRGLLAGLAYFALVFALGFGFGVLRVLLVPDAGSESRRLAAVALEIPLMLAASWIACAALVRRLRLPPTMAPRLAMGGLALGLLLLTEFLLGALLMGRDLAQQLADYARPSYALGLAAQCLFGALPLWVARRGGAR